MRDLKYVKSVGGYFYVTLQGWSRIAELERERSSPEKPVFVAMWYGDEATADEMTALYDKGIEPAVSKAGYLVTRADLQEHNEFIMDKVLGDIKVTPFVVVDFTGHRNGVYFEAGFARGLGITVINTCKRSEFGRAHFDTQQLNHLLWDTPSDLVETLYHRIRGTVGMGPHAPEA